MTHSEWDMGNAILRRHGTTGPMVDIGGIQRLVVSRYRPQAGVWHSAEADPRPWAHVDPSYEIVNPGEGGRLGDPPVEIFALQRPRDFRTVFCTSVLEHTQNPWAAMYALAALLLPGGLLYVSTPWIWPTHGDPTQDRWRFSPAGLQQLCHVVDLDVLETGFTEQLVGRETAYVCASRGPLQDRAPATFTDPTLVELVSP